MKRRHVLGALSGILATTAGCTGTSGSGPSPSATPHPENVARHAVEQGLDSGDAWVESTREIQIQPIESSYRIDVRYVLDYRTVGGEFTAEKAERRAGWTAWAMCRELKQRDPPGYDGLAAYAYVPTGDDEVTVSTKVVIGSDAISSIDYSASTWKDVRANADQYKFNAYLY